MEGMCAGCVHGRECIYVCMSVCISVCVCMYVYVCMCVCTYMCILRIYIHTYIYIAMYHVHACTHTNMHNASIQLTWMYRVCSNRDGDVPIDLHDTQCLMRSVRGVMASCECYVCVLVCMCMCISMHVYVHFYACVCVLVCMCICALVCVYMCRTTNITRCCPMERHVQICLTTFHSAEDKQSNGDYQHSLHLHNQSHHCNGVFRFAGAS